MYSSMLRRALILAIVFMLAVPVFAVGSQIEPEVLVKPLPEPNSLVGRTICIDPGHGGSQPGTTGIDGPGYPDEKDHNLDMALRLQGLLLAKGATVIMTRETDIDVSLADRCTIANGAGADIFLSIHCNAIGSETTQGTETFYWGVDAGTYSINGRRLAENVNEELVVHLKSNDRGAIMDFPYFGYHLYVLANTAMPAALTEVGFMSNQTEFDLLNQTWYRQRAAEAMLEGILRYYRPDASPMRINSDAEMSAMDISEGWPGDGSVGSPYIIEEYDIEGTGSGYCMYIGNVSQSFIVRNCSLHRASGNYVDWNYDTGLYIYNSPNAKVDNISGYLNGGYGIRIQSSNNAEVKFSNTHMNDYYGIYFRFSNWGQILNNTADLNIYSGIIIYQSDNNILSGNSLEENDLYGIYADGCQYLQASDNWLYDNNDYGIYLINSADCNTTDNFISQHDKVGIYIYNSDWCTASGNDVLFSDLAGILISPTSTQNTIEFNNVSRNPLYGIQIGDVLGAATFNDVNNNTVNDTAFFGIYVLNSQDNEIHGNTLFDNGEFGIYIKLSQYIDVHHNLAYDNVYGICLRYSSHDVTIRNNTCHSNNKFGSMFTTSGIAIEYNSYQNTVTGNQVYGQNLFTGTGMILQECGNNTISSNNISDNVYGIYLYDTNYTEISKNDIADNENGALLDEFCTYSTIASNNFYNNLVQANDSSGSINNWDAGYPAGGNYWNDFSGTDSVYGQNQDMLGSDGILDSQYDLIQNTSSVDNYPLASPFNYVEVDVILQPGWNLISLSMRQLNWSFDSVLASISGKWDRAFAYYSADTVNPWRSYSVLKPDSLNDLAEMSHFNGYWVNVTEACTFTASGDLFSTQLSIPIKAGWNLIGHLGLAGQTVSTCFAGTGYDRVEVFDDGAPYLISQVGDGYVLQPGQGVWARVPVDVVWVLD